MSKEAQMNPRDYCIYGCCFSGGGPWCNRCGFNRYEDKRRRNLPLVKGEDGISRKYVGITSMLVAVALFTVTMIFLYARFGGVPDTLIISFFGFCGGEAGFMGLIKCNDAKYENKGKAADGSDDAAVG